MRIKFNLNIFLAMLFYEWRKDISQPTWDSRNYQIMSRFVSRPVSTQDFEFITKLTVIKL